MARQKQKSSDRFGSGGNKDGSPEEKFFTGDTDIQIDPEWKAMEMLRVAIDDLTDVVNANDEASGSYADLKKDYTLASGSFSTRVALNDAKTSMVIGSKETHAKAGNTTTISTSQASAITANTAKTGITTSQASAISANTSKTGITTSQASAISANTSKTGITSDQASAITANTAKKGITDGQVSAIEANTAKVTNAFDFKAITTNTASHALAFSVTNNRGTYALVITMTDSSGRDKVVKTATIPLG